MNFTEQRPGHVLRDFSHNGERHAYVYVFPRETAHLVLGVHRNHVEKSLLLLDAAGDLLTLASDKHRFTRNVKLPDGTQARLIVLRECKERLKAERIARLRWDEARPKSSAVAWI